VPDGKPTVDGLGLDVDALVWHRSGGSSAEGAIEVAFGEVDRVTWVLVRVSGDPAQRVLVFDRYEWECFVEGAKNGEFDEAAG
jgi:hypothetical protein